MRAEEALYQFVRSEEGLALAFQWTPQRTELRLDQVCYFFYMREKVTVHPPLVEQTNPLSISVLLLSTSLHVTFFFPFWMFASVIAFAWNPSPPTSGFLFPSFKSQHKCPLLWEAAVIAKILSSFIYSIELLIALNYNRLFPSRSSLLN